MWYSLLRISQFYVFEKSKRHTMLAIFTVLYKLLLLIPSLLGVGFLIAFHELGHLLFCKIFNVAAPSFSIGFGPALLKKTIGETDFTLSSIPLGGYVEIAGEETNELNNKKSSFPPHRLFKNKPYYQKICILAGGILFNLTFAYAALTALLMTSLPQTPLLYPFNATTKVSNITPESPAEKAGIQSNDRIIAFDNENTDDSHATLINKLRNHANKSIQLTVQRDQQVLTKEVHLTSHMPAGHKTGYLGASFHMQALAPHSFLQASYLATRIITRFSINIYYVLKNLITSRTTQGTSGPIMIFAATMKGFEKGTKIFFLFLAFLSINLACLNLVPLPILDGGQILFTSIEALIRRELPETIKLYFAYGCWLLLLALTIYISCQDILYLITD